MQTLAVTATATDQDLPEGTKILALTDNSEHVTYISFTGDADPESEDSIRMNTGRNVYQVPEGVISFSVLGDGEYTIGMDCLKSRGDTGEGSDAVNAQLADHEARITALEAAGAAGGASVTAVKVQKPQPQHPPSKSKHDDDDHHHHQKDKPDHAARKK